MLSYVELCRYCDELPNSHCRSCRYRKTCNMFIKRYGINPGSMYRFAKERNEITSPKCPEEVMLQKIQKVYGKPDIKNRAQVYYEKGLTYNEVYHQGRADAIDEFVKAFCDNENQRCFITLNQHKHSWDSYAEHIAKKLKEEEK